VTFEIAPAQAENRVGGSWSGAPFDPGMFDVPITSLWGPRSVITFPDGSTSGGFHNGIDLRVPLRTQLYAPDDGTVRSVSRTDAGGNVLQLDHDDGFITLYLHLAELPDLAIGRAVVRGEPIALSGNSGRFTIGPHLHFGVWRNGASLNPVDFVQVVVPQPWPPPVPTLFGPTGASEYMPWLEQAAQAFGTGYARVEVEASPNTTRLLAEGWKRQDMLWRPK